MLKEKLKGYTIILASGSPRRQQFFKELDLDFDIRLKDVAEIYDENLKAEAITNYLAELKASAFTDELTDKDIFDTVNTFYSWRTNNYIDRAEYSKSVTLQEIEKNNFSLIPSRYISFYDKDLEIDFESEMKELHSEISNNISEQKKVIQELSEVLKSMGYEI